MYVHGSGLISLSSRLGPISSSRERPSLGMHAALIFFEVAHEMKVVGAH